MSRDRSRNRARGFSGGAALNPLARWSTDLAAVVAGTGNARILCMGDSTMHGSTGAGTNQRPNETKALANLFVTNGIKAHDDANFGMSDFSAAKRLYKDLRYTGTFTMYSAGTLGGFMAQGTAIGQTLTYTPETVCDTFRVFFWSTGTGASTSTVIIQATGGTPTSALSMSTIGQAFGTTSLRYIDVSAATLTAGNSVTITMAAGILIPLVAVECWDSTASQVIIVNAGHHGSSTPNWIVESASLRAPLDILKNFPDGYYSAVYIRPGINDSGNANPIEGVYKPNLRTIRNGVGSKSSFIIGAANPISSGAVDPYNVANAELAAELGAAFINSRVDANFDTYAHASAAGLMVDTLHPDPSGFALMAGYDYAVLNP